MGGVSIGWAVMLTLVVRAAIAAGEVGRPLWNAVSAGMAAWFVIDSTLSVATGFAMNVAPNTLLAGMYLVGLFGSGALRRAA
jgi:predicted Na+-dependent transporter